MKKNSFSIAFILALLVMIMIPGNTFAQKTDYSAIVGTWEISMEGRDGNVMTTDWEFFLKDDKLCAKIQAGMGGGRRGGGGGDRPPMEIEDIEFDGESLSFEMERGRGERTMVIEYTATIKEGKMEGEMAIGDRATREFTGKKKK
ncbi:MAG: hypothetical protein GY863_24930 [bacterium]|nr:hypothetical protein [bacterium]